MIRDWAAFEAFLKTIEQRKAELQFEPGEECFYRGHADVSWPLQPTLMRAGLGEEQLRELEADLFFEFQARGRELHHQNLTDWDVLFYMRHHGVPTRLLDWTESFGIALFFAVAANPASAASRPCIWILNPYALNEYTLTDRDLITPKNLGYDADEDYYYDYGELLLEPDGFDWRWPLALYPQQKSARMGAQRGWFTIHGSEHGAVDKLRPDAVRCVEIPADAVATARYVLDLMGIDRYLLFQDLDGLAAALIEKYRWPGGAVRSKGRASNKARQRMKTSKQTAAAKKPVARQL